MIDQGTIDRIMDAAHIEEVVGEFVTLRKRGVNYVGLCPFHDEKTASFSVSPTRGICKCFSCGKGGNSVHFIMEHEQLNYYEALKWLANKYHIEVVEKAISPEEQQVKNDRESLFILNEFARDYFVRTLHEHIDGKSIGMGYFRERGFREDIIRKFQLGFSLEKRDAFSMEALSKGYKSEFLVKTGLSIAYDNGVLNDRFRGRVLFPVHTLSGKVVAFGGRILKKEEKAAKYVNSPESEIYHKSNELYGIYFAKQAIAKLDKCFLVEGYTDVLAMHQAGVENVVSSSGTALTHGQIRMIHRFTQNVTVLYDGDAAGIKASLKGINLLLEEGLNIKVLLLPAGEDPDSFSRQYNSSEFIQYLKEHETDFIRFKTEILLKDAGNDPIKRVGLIQDLVESISLISDDITRSVYVKECSQQLDFDEALLLQQVNKKRYNLLQRERQKKVAEQHGFSPSGNQSSNTSTNQNNYSGYMKVDTPTPPSDFGAPPPNNEMPPPMDEQASSNGMLNFNLPTSIQTQATTKPSGNPLDEYEHNILKLVLRFGERTVCVEDHDDGTRTNVNVTEYVIRTLEEDQIIFKHDGYKLLLSEACTIMRNPDYNPQRFFQNHRDPKISLLAADILSEPYELSKYHARYQEVGSDADKLEELIPRVLEDLKYAIVRQESRALEDALKLAQRDNNEEEVTRITHELIDLMEVKRNLGKRLGERIVVR